MTETLTKIEMEKNIHIFVLYTKWFQYINNNYYTY